VNILGALFGIFRKKGLVTTLQEGKTLRPLFLMGLPFIALGGALYGVAMGIGIGPDVAVTDAIKVALVFLLSFLLSYPIFLISYRLLGREERASQIAAIPLTLLAALATLMVVTSPVVFMLSLLVGYTAEAVYIHVTILNLGLLMGLYLAGSLVFFSFTEERSRLLIPNIIGMVMLGLITGVLIAFFNPFLEPSTTFSVGTDQLKDGLGIGVAPKVTASFYGAQESGRMEYRYRELDAHGNAERDYTLTRAGENYHLLVSLHAVPGEDIVEGAEIWIIEGHYYHNLAGPVREVPAEELSTFLDPVLPETVLDDPLQLEPTMRYRARLFGGEYTITGRTADGQKLTVFSEAATGRLLSFRWARPEGQRPAVVEVGGLSAATQDKADFQDSLHRATVLGRIDRSDATMQDYVNAEAFFALRYPRTWHTKSSWVAQSRRVSLSSCSSLESCPELTVAVFDLVPEWTAQNYAQEQAQSLERDPAYRSVQYSTVVVGETSAGLVEYLFDTVKEGEVRTTENVEYIFVGKECRYHLRFSAPEGQLAEYMGLFEAIAGQFVYLQ
jgi:hypothetical protein